MHGFMKKHLPYKIASKRQKSYGTELADSVLHSMTVVIMWGTNSTRDMYNYIVVSQSVELLHHNIPSNIQQS